LELVHKYEHPDYYSNSWMVKVASNGRYVAAPTNDGNVFIFNLKSGEPTCILRHHEEGEMRDVVFHDSRKLLFTSGDGFIF
jgi:WD40 repeat protein